MPLFLFSVLKVILISTSLLVFKRKLRIQINQSVVQESYNDDRMMIYPTQNIATTMTMKLPEFSF